MVGAVAATGATVVEASRTILAAAASEALGAETEAADLEEVEVAVFAASVEVVSVASGADESNVTDSCNVESVKLAVSIQTRATQSRH